MRPRLHDLQPLVLLRLDLRFWPLDLGLWTLAFGPWPFFQPFRKLITQQFAKKAAHTYIREKISPAPDGVPFLFIISINGTIQGELHEANEGDCPVHSYLGSYFFTQLAQAQRAGADLATSGPDGITFMAKIDAFFNLMFEQKASDLHLSSGNNPMLRINGELQRVDHPPLDNDELKKMLYEIP